MHFIIGFAVLALTTVILANTSAGRVILKGIGILITLVVLVIGYGIYQIARTTWPNKPDWTLNCGTTVTQPS